MSGRWSWLGLTVMVTLVVAGCASSGQGETFTTSESGLRVFASPTTLNGLRVVCNAIVLPDGVRGTLRVTPGENEVVWLEAPDGRHVSVAWPAGFTLELDPSPTIHDDAGEEIAVEGEMVRLGQTSPESASGTPEDPYLATRCGFEMTPRVRV